MITIDKNKCIGCQFCVKDCVVANIELTNEKADIKKDTCLLCGHCIAICPQNAIAMDNYPMEEVKEFNKETFLLKPETLLNFIQFRRSIRSFKEEQIEKDKLLQIIEAGRFTATGGNRQDVSYIIVQDKLAELRRLALERLCETTAKLAKENAGFTGLANRWKNQLEDDKEQPGKNDGLFYNAPTVLLITSNSPVDAALAASNMELMAASLGIGALYVGFIVNAAKGEDKIKNLLDLTSFGEIRVCLALGKPTVSYARTAPRKPAAVEWR